MKLWLKILLAILVLIFVAAGIFYQTMLKANFLEPPDLKGTYQSRSITLDGQERLFSWYTPPTLSSRALLFALHGSTSSGEEFRKHTAYEFDKLADEKGFVVVYPTGYYNHWNDCRASADYRANTDNINDIAFLKQLERALGKLLRIQFDYRFAVGHSNGGHMCFTLAFEEPDWINGIAPISANLPVPENRDCTTKNKFVPLILVNGTEDRINPYEGGLVSIMGNDSRGSVFSTDQTMTYWTALDSCDLKMSQQSLSDISETDHSVVSQSNWGCKDQTRAVLLKIEGGGHTIPHPESQLPRILGETNRDINSPQLIWAFFEKLIKSKK